MTKLYDIAVDLKAAATSVMTDRGITLPGKRAVIHGEATFDDCCDGFLWVRWTQQFLTDQFPNQQQSPMRCATLVPVAIYEVGIVRCTTANPTELGNGNIRFPAAAELEADAQVAYDDAAAVLHGVYCAAREWGKDRRFVIGQQDPITPDGGCHGSQLTITVEIS